MAQHHDAVSDLRDYSEVVTDVEGRRPVERNELFQMGQHLDLRRHIECGRRLI